MLASDRRLVLLSVATALAGCATLDDSVRVTAYLNKEITGDTAGACLARGYQALARREAARDVNYLAASQFVRRAEAAQRGESVSPWHASDLRAPAERTGELDQARTRLVSVLASGGDACVCAGAQSAYDGWVADARFGDWGALREQFVKAVAACESSVPRAASDGCRGTDFSAKTAQLGGA
jgi:hypothetical protein